MKSLLSSNARMRLIGTTVMAGAAIAGLAQFAATRTAEAATAPVTSTAAFPMEQVARTAPSHRATAVLAGGCFWGMEEVFSALRGVSDVTSGYSGGAAKTAHYESVELGTTGHAESIKITYDPALISYEKLLEVYFTVAHDPTQVDAQAPDSGPQYRSEIFYVNEAQHLMAQRMIANLNASKKFAAPIATKVEPLKAFYPAEAYHQDFAARNPDNSYIVAVDNPRMERLRQLFPKLVK